MKTESRITFSGSLTTGPTETRITELERALKDIAHLLNSSAPSLVRQLQIRNVIEAVPNLILATKY